MQVAVREIDDDSTDDNGSGLPVGGKGGYQRERGGTWTPTMMAVRVESPDSGYGGGDCDDG